MYALHKTTQSPEYIFLPPKPFEALCWADGGCLVSNVQGYGWFKFKLRGYRWTWDGLRSSAWASCSVWSHRFGRLLFQQVLQSGAWSREKSQHFQLPLLNLSFKNKKLSFNIKKKGSRKRLSWKPDNFAAGESKLSFSSFNCSVNQGAKHWASTDISVNRLL